VADPVNFTKLAEAEVEVYRTINLEDLVPDLPPANTFYYDFWPYGGLTGFTVQSGAWPEVASPLKFSLGFSPRVRSCRSPE